MPIYWYTYTALVKGHVKGFSIDPTNHWDYAKVSLR
jgi:hypothetical protein